jgi:hypothetical protein
VGHSSGLRGRHHDLNADSLWLSLVVLLLLLLLMEGFLKTLHQTYKNYNDFTGKIHNSTIRSAVTLLQQISLLGNGHQNFNIQAYRSMEFASPSY